MNDLYYYLFQRLDPLNVPKLTAEDLAEKQRIADEKRDAVSVTEAFLLLFIKNILLFKLSYLK